MHACSLMQTPVPGLPAGTQDPDQLTHLLPDSQRSKLGRLNPEGKHARTQARTPTEHESRCIYRQTHSHPLLIANNHELIKWNKACSCQDILQNIHETSNSDKRIPKRRSS